jgi:hypothetical protein
MRFADLSRVRRDAAARRCASKTKTPPRAGGGDEDGGNDVPDRRLLHRGPV